MFALLLRDELLASKKGLNWTRGWDCGGGGGGGEMAAESGGVTLATPQQNNEHHNHKYA
jgi:hypothetical protein